MRKKFNEKDAEKLVRAVLGPDAFERKTGPEDFEETHDEVGEQIGEKEVLLLNLYEQLFYELKNPGVADPELYKSIKEEEDFLYELLQKYHPRKNKKQIHKELGGIIEDLKERASAKINGVNLKNNKNKNLEFSNSSNNLKSNNMKPKEITQNQNNQGNQEAERLGLNEELNKDIREELERQADEERKNSSSFKENAEAKEELNKDIKEELERQADEKREKLLLKENGGPKENTEGKVVERSEVKKVGEDKKESNDNNIEKIRGKLQESRQELAKALYGKEKTQKDLAKLSGWREMLSIFSQPKDKAGIEEDLKKWDESFEKEQENFKNILKEYRQSLIMAKEAELSKQEKSEDEIKKELSQYAKEVAILTSAKEAIELHNLKENQKIEQMSREKKWLKEKALKVVDWYRHLPVKAKIAISAGLFGAGLAAGAIGGATGAAILSGVFVGRLTQRAFGGAATAVALESKIKSSQEKSAEKKISRELADDLLEKIKEQNEELNQALDKKLFDLTSRKASEETRRYILAGMAGGLIASGAVAQAFRSLWDFVPQEWKISGFGKPVNAAGGVEDGKASVIESGGVKGAAGDMTEAAPKISSEVIVEKGDSVWKIMEKQAEARGLFKGLGNSPEDIAKKTYIIDALKDKVEANPEKFGLADSDKLKIGQKINFSSVFEDENSLKSIRQSADHLNEDQIKNILKNNEENLRKNKWAKIKEGEKIKWPPEEEKTDIDGEEIKIVEIDTGILNNNLRALGVLEEAGEQLDGKPSYEILKVLATKNIGAIREMVEQIEENKFDLMKTGDVSGSVSSPIEVEGITNPNFINRYIEDFWKVIKQVVDREKVPDTTTLEELLLSKKF